MLLLAHEILVNREVQPPTERLEEDSTRMMAVLGETTNVGSHSELYALLRAVPADRSLIVCEQGQLGRGAAWRRHGRGPKETHAGKETENRLEAGGDPRDVTLLRAARPPVGAQTDEPRSSRSQRWSSYPPRTGNAKLGPKQESMTLGHGRGRTPFASG